MNKKHGFTLIELLAVIVVLAIIALIATPIVMNTIKRSKKGAAERSAENYIEAIETAVATERLEGNILEGEYIVQSDGNLCPVSGCGENDKDKVVIEMNGNKPTSGTITINNGQVTTNSTMTIGEYDVSYDETSNKYVAIKLETYSITYNLTNVSGDNSNGVSITTKGAKTLKFTANKGYRLPEGVTVSGATSVWNKETGTLILSKATGDVIVTIVGEEIPLYKNGEVVYFNVTTGKKCSDYKEAQSNTGVKEGCMKFYAFNDDGKDTVNLLLDHNTTATSIWVNYENYNPGPEDLLKQLKSDTDSWKGTLTPTSYNTTFYNIDYKDYNARIITVEEISQIVGDESFNFEDYLEDVYYFSTHSSTPSNTCNYDNISGCKYGWLYDRTHINCTDFGCLNNSDQATYGYWTLTYSFYEGVLEYVFAVNCDESLLPMKVFSDSEFGVRPVITVAKSQLG